MPAAKSSEDLQNMEHRKLITFYKRERKNIWGKREHPQPPCTLRPNRAQDRGTSGHPAAKAFVLLH